MKHGKWKQGKQKTETIEPDRTVNTHIEHRIMLDPNRTYGAGEGTGADCGDMQGT